MGKMIIHKSLPREGWLCGKFEYGEDISYMWQRVNCKQCIRMRRTDAQRVREWRQAQRLKRVGAFIDGRTNVVTDTNCPSCKKQLHVGACNYGAPK